MIKIDMNLINEMKEKKCNAMVGMFSYGLRTNYLLDEKANLKEILNIVFYEDGKELFSIGKYFNGIIDERKSPVDIRKLFLSDVKNRRKVNLNNKENFYCKGVLYLYNGLDIEVGEPKEDEWYSDTLKTIYHKVVKAKFKNNFVHYGVYGEEDKQNNIIEFVLSNSIRQEKTKQGESMEALEKELIDNKIRIPRYELIKLLEKYDLIKK